MCLCVCVHKTMYVGVSVRKEGKASEMYIGRNIAVGNISNVTIQFCRWQGMICRGRPLIYHYLKSYLQQYVRLHREKGHVES